MAKFCTSCGSPLEETSKFCMKCGTPAGAPSGPAEAPGGPASARPPAAPAAGVVAAGAPPAAKAGSPVLKIVLIVVGHFRAHWRSWIADLRLLRLQDEAEVWRCGRTRQNDVE